MNDEASGRITFTPDYAVVATMQRQAVCHICPPNRRYLWLWLWLWLCNGIS